jgi:hypothetical protein
VRYWGWLAAKLALSAAAMYGLLAALGSSWPAQRIGLSYSAPKFGHDLSYTLGVGLWFLLACGVLYLCVLDQRYRCRVCLRRLRMPVETGSWSRMLFLGRPRIEYICPYGHGTLVEEELQISGIANPEWTPGTDLWEDLCAAGEDRDRKS